MKQLSATIILLVTMSAAQADGFSPWADRAAIESTPSSGTEIREPSFYAHGLPDSGPRREDTADRDIVIGPYYRMGV